MIVAPGMVGFGRVHAVSDSLHLYEPETPLSQLRKRLLRRMLE
jgi:hypothetical protein